MNIGLKIKQRRLALGYTLEEVAKRVGTSKQTIHRYETGIISNIPSDKIEALAEVLQTTPAYIMGWETQSNVPSTENQLKNSPSSKENGLSDSQKEIIALFDSAPPELQAAALAVLKSAEPLPQVQDDDKANQ